MKDTQRDSCVFVQVADAIMPQGDLFSVHKNIRKLSAKHSVLSAPTQLPLRLNLPLCPPACWMTLLLFHVCMEQRLSLFGEVTLLCVISWCIKLMCLFTLNKLKHLLHLVVKTIVIDKTKLWVIHRVLHKRTEEQCCSWVWLHDKGTIMVLEISWHGTVVWDCTAGLKWRTFSLMIQESRNCWKPQMKYISGK